MNLLAIGTAVQDTIIDGSSVRHSPGGIVYSAATLSALSDENDKLFLATALPAKIPSVIQEAFTDIHYYHITPAPSIPEVTLTIHPEKERDEKFDYCDIPLTVPADRLGEMDGILVNMITGFDLTLDSLSEIRSKFGGTVYIDIHSLSRGVDSKFRRHFRKIPDSGKWLQCADIVQCNHNELMMLSVSDDPKEIIRFVFENGVKYLILTKGNRGASIYFNTRGEIESLYAAPPRINVVSTVGCGDVFGGTFFYYFIKTNDAFNSFYRAVECSAFSAGYGAVNEIKNIKKDVISGYN